MREDPEAVAEDGVDHHGRRPSSAGIRGTSRYERERASRLGAPGAARCCSRAGRSSSARDRARRRRSGRRGRGDRAGGSRRPRPPPTSTQRTPAMPGKTTSPPTDDVLTTCAGPPCSIIPGTNALIPWITPHRLTPRSHCHSRSSNSHVAPGRLDAGVVAQEVDRAEALRGSLAARRPDVLPDATRRPATASTSPGAPTEPRRRLEPVRRRRRTSRRAFPRPRGAGPARARCRSRPRSRRPSARRACPSGAGARTGCSIAVRAAVRAKTSAAASPPA